MPLPSLNEMLADRRATERDVRVLNEIVEALTTFIEEPHGEDRSRFRTDLLKYTSLRSEGLHLLDKINAAIESVQ